ncbi:EF-hand domain-containing protein [Caenorhabditis elegans]|uniref:EF-hand domain-containing protein n=1 Tax=Caenorhabditis elegans TaxID=6239 RepID=A0A486WVK8_CAEEL|nr:EF-hand domain-containing protein [Caenorhabditis elegans]VGM69555.1 EF-hand domain-containing protein [Caenorhabditis elegans]
MKRVLSRFWGFSTKHRQHILNQRIVERTSARNVAVLTAAGIGTSIGAYQLIDTARAGILVTDGSDDASRHNVTTDHKLTKRELRFLQFASVEYDDVIYMSPMDFIDSLTLDAPRERVYRRVLKEKDIQRILKKTPPFRSGGKHFFRTMDQSGIISYSEYIFLLTLLTKSKAAFRIAFLMFDEDDNGNIDRDEFMLIARMFASKAATLSGTRLVHKSEEEVRKQDTTLLLHLFGLRGNATLSFDEFQQFYENLQEELMEIEFYEFARGKTAISPVDFARLILRYSIVNFDDYHKYLQRVQEKSDDDEPGISLSQWATFSRFLNNLAEFQSAVRLYVNSNVPVSEPEFARAVGCTIGKELDPVVVSMIFRIFDENNDGTLSYPEFLAVMSDRLHRGLRGRLEKPWGWKPFKNCVISEVSRA